MNSSNIILALVISLSLLSFKSSNSINPKTVYLQSCSPQLRGLLFDFNNYVLGLPSGRELRVQADNCVFR